MVLQFDYSLSIKDDLLLNVLPHPSLIVDQMAWGRFPIIQHVDQMAWGWFPTNQH